ncbi:MAG: helix-turn-helix domain-containing protein [Christensenellales bacterium]
MRLKELRKQKGLTQEELGNILHVNKMTYNGYENENRQPSIETLCKIADYYGVTLDYLVNRNFTYDVGFVSDEQKDILRLLHQLDVQNLARVKAYIEGIISNQ